MQVAAGLLDRISQNGGKAKMLENCDHIGESFMECQNIHVGWFEKPVPKSMRYGVRHFVCNDVVRKTREYGLPRRILAELPLIRRKIAEQQGMAMRTKKCIGTREGVWEDLESARSPKLKAASQCDFEILDDLHRHGIHHLLVKSRVEFGGLETALHKNGGVIKVDGLVKAAGHSIVVENFNARTARTRRQRFIQDVERNPMER